MRSWAVILSASAPSAPASSSLSRPLGLGPLRATTEQCSSHPAQLHASGKRHLVSRGVEHCTADKGARSSLFLDNFLVSH
jgi:hypothetical protein